MANLNEVNGCQMCTCLCWLVSAGCIVSMSELTEATVVRTNDINNANDDVGDLLGELCFEQLCAALSKAVLDANAYNEVPENEDKKSALDFLETKWVLVITNRHFKKWYSNRVAWHWFEGSSITQIKKVGLITTSNDDEDFKNSFKHAANAERKRLAAVSERNASAAKAKFLKHYWDCNTELYDCNPVCGCDDKADNSGESIGMVTLD